MSAGAHDPVEVAPGIFRFRDTCNVYVLRSGREAVLVDFGAGDVLDRLGDLGVDRVTDVLLTHHHRDQLQGLARAAAAGIRIWVPPVEQDLIAGADLHWQTRQVENDYDLRQDRFSILEQVPVAGTLAEYRTQRFGGVDVFTLPTPGHTIGSVTFLVDAEATRVAFSGDLLYGDGKVWSLAATQWTYGGVEGQAATVVSAGILGDRHPDVLLPSHGDPIEDPAAAIALMRGRLQELLDTWRAQPWDLERWQRQPWDPVTPHLLRNRTCLAHSYALLSESGAALLIDWGYDMHTGTTNASVRATRRPLLASLESLKRDYGVERIEVVVPTHFHDDHVGGINLLRDVEGAEVWAAENVAPILESPERYDLPCLWFDPIAVDRTLPLDTPFRWQEYELTLHELPGHTLYAVAISFEVDGKRVVAGGDQYGTEGDKPILNYFYRNRFRIDDYVASAALYRSLRPDIVVSGHWLPLEVTDEYLDRIEADGRRVAELHRELLPLGDVDLGAEGFGARIVPYRSRVRAGATLEVEVEVRNPFDRDDVAAVRLVAPAGWHVEPEQQDVALAAHETRAAAFTVRPTGPPVRRARIAADLTVGGVRFGQQAEALVDVE
jgi:glyoxylase-like metal-dependent hydrolase (beta-lactamase superfamily II)